MQNTLCIKFAIRAEVRRSFITTTVRHYIDSKIAVTVVFRVYLEAD